MTSGLNCHQQRRTMMNKAIILTIVLALSNYITFNDLQMTEGDLEKREDAIEFANRTMEF